MSWKSAGFSRLMSTVSVLALAVGLLTALSLPIFGQQASTTVTESTAKPLGIPQDWTHHHMVFSNPGTAAEAMAQGKYDQWLKVTQSARYQMQSLMRNRLSTAGATAATAEAGTDVASAMTAVTAAATSNAKSGKKSGVNKDWSMNLGVPAGASVTGVIGTLNSSTISSSSTLTIDGVTFTASAPTPATQTGTFSSAPLTTSAAITVKNGATNTLTITSGGTPASITGTISGVPVTANTVTLTTPTGTVTLNPNPGAATDTGTFSGIATSTSAPSITAKQGANTLTMTTNATAATTTATVNSVPTTTGNTLSIVNGNGTINLAPTNATASKMTGTFGGVPTTATEPTITIKQGTGPTTTSMTVATGVAAASTTFTVNTVPTSASTTALAINNAIGTISMAPTSATQSTATGTFASVPTTSTSPTITVKQGAGPTTTSMSVATGATAASTTFTVGSVPTTTGTALTINNAFGTINLATNATPQSDIGTFAAYPTSTSVPTITIKQGANTLNLTTNATESTATASFSAAPTTSTTATIANYSNTLGLTGALGNTSGTITIDHTPTNGDTITIGGVVYTLSTSSCGTTADCILIVSGNHPAMAQNIYAAINATSAECSTSPCFGSNTTANPDVVATYSSGASALTINSAILSTTVTFSTSDTTNITVTGSPIAIPTNNTCSSATTGTFVLNNVPASAATNLAAAINTCTGAHSAIDLSAGTVTAGSFTITSTVLGYASFTGTNNLTLTPAGGNTSANGSNACSTSTTGTFQLAPASTVPTIATEATALAGAINLCPAGAGVTAGTVTGTGFTASDRALGTDTTFSATSTATGIFSWGGVTGGSDGSNSCTTPGSATFALAASGLPSTTTVAGQLAIALNDCGAGSGISTVTASGSTDPVTDSVLGYATFSAANGLTVSPANGGNNGTGANTCSGTTGTFTLASASTGTVPSTTTEAGQFQTAIAACTGTGFAVSNVTGGIKVTDSALGYDNTFLVNSTQTGVFSWGSGVTYGSNGTNSCTTPGSAQFALASGTTTPGTSTVAGQVAAALSLCTTSGINTVTASGSTDPVSDSVLGYATFTAANGLTVSPANGGNNGTGPNTCSGLTGTFTLASASTGTLPTTSTEASQLQAALAACTGTGVTIGTASTNTLPITDVTLGYDTTFTGTSSQSSIFSWGVPTYGSNGAQSCTTPTAATFVLGATSTTPVTTSTVATGLASAINTCAGSGISTITASTNTVPITDSILGYATFTASNGTSVPASAGTNGSNACGTTTSGTFMLAPNGTTIPSTTFEAEELALALAACPTGAGVNGSWSAGTSLTLTDRTLGYDTTFIPGVTSGTGIFSWAAGGVTQGSNGSAGCTGGSPITGTFALAPASTTPTTLTVASGVATAFNGCPAAIGLTASYSSGSTYTAGTTALGTTATISGSTNAGGVYSFGTATPGANGSTNCTSATTATYQYSSTLATLAGNLNQAIATSCAAYEATTGVTSSYSGSGNAITLSAAVPGTGANTGFTLAPTSGYFTWSGAGLANGTNGSATTTTFPYWTGTTYDTASALATSIATAMTSNGTVDGIFTITANSPSAGDLTITDRTTGGSGNSYSLVPASFSAFSGGGSLAGGSNGSVGAGNYPAKYSFSTTAAGNCASTSPPDYVVYNTGSPGSSGSANIIAFDNIYSGCSGTVPTFYWAYNTGTGSVLTSPVISRDGTMIAFVESASTGSTLRILKFHGAQGTNYSAPVAPGQTATNGVAGSGGQSWTSWSACTATVSCMISVPFQSPGAYSDSNSSPWYDYDSDTIYVGDDQGYLHQFTGVFLGTPGEVISATAPVWPVNVAGGDPLATAAPLTGPVYDNVNAYVYVGDRNGYLNSISIPNADLTSSTGIGYAAPDISAPVLDDPYAGEVYAFLSQGPNGYISVVQFPYNFGAGAAGTVKDVSTVAGTTPAFSGTFDNAYYTYPSDPPSGNLWVCGGSTVNNDATLYSIAITSGVMGTVTTGPVVGGSGTAPCSPVTEFYNPSGGTSSSATGSITISGTVAIGWAGSTITIAGPNGNRTYTFVTGAPTAANQVELYTSSTATFNRYYTAYNLAAVLLDASGDCESASCVYSGQTADPNVTATHNTFTNVVPLTAKTTGTAGDFTLGGTASPSDVTESETNGTDLGLDYIAVSPTDAGTVTGCTSGSGCVITYHVSTAGVASSPAGGLFTGGASGISIDTENNSVSGALELYFGILGSATCTGAGGVGTGSGGCAIQASQTAP